MTDSTNNGPSGLPKPSQTSETIETPPFWGPLQSSRSFVLRVRRRGANFKKRARVHRTALTATFASRPGTTSIHIHHHQPARPENAGYRSSGPNHFMTTSRHGPPPPHRPSSMNMGGIRSALPDYQSNHVPFDQYHQPQVDTQYTGVFYPMPPPQSFHGGEATDGRSPAYMVHYQPVYPHYFQQHPHQQPSFPGYHTFMHRPPPHPGTHSPMFGQASGYGPGYYPSPYPMMLGHSPGPPPGPQGYLQSGPQYANPHGPTTLGTPPPFPNEGLQRHIPKQGDSYDVSKTIVDGSVSMRTAGPQSRVPETPSLSSTPTRTATPGGPRRTPKQSGHALWVGNLPPGTSVVQLKDHFSRDVANDIESVFLIAKSNCAFINYKTEAVCSAAQEKFHDSRFQGVRLVCRLRRGVVPTGGGISATSPGRSEDDDSSKIAESAANPETGPAENKTSSLEKVPNRYFVVKSLTVEDLESSKQSGIWATQTHNEANFNRAYETADNVYLIFSANKSGGYYGYARMVSPIQEDEKLALEMPQRLNQITTEVEEPNVTLTQATSTAPSGRIIDDPARGTIFWEADTSSEEEEEEVDAKCEKGAGPAATENSTADAGGQTIGRPFRIQWLSTERVPFHRTRGLRNPWNANRGVKIARDGTEIEPSVGAQIVELFHIPLYSGPGIATYRVPN